MSAHGSGALVTCAALLLMCAFPQQPRLPTFRSHVAGVRVDALVTDHGRPVTDLTADNFEVLDNGRLQRIDSVTVVNDLAVVVLLDLSISVQRIDYAGTRHLEAMRQLMAAAGIVADLLGPRDSGSLLVFSDRSALALTKQSNAASFKAALADAAKYTAQKQLRFGTAMWDAVFAGASLVTLDPRRPIVVLLSDQGDNASFLCQTGPGDATWTRRQKNVVLNSLTEAGVVIDVVDVPRKFLRASGFDDQVYGPLPDEAARGTGGRVFSADDQRLREKLSKRFEELRATYVLTFTPPGTREPGWHRITIRLKKASGEVRAREGYFVGPAT